MATRETPEFVQLCPLSDIRPNGEGRHFRPATGRWRNKAMAVFEEAGKFYAMNFVCPHSGGPMSEGWIRDGIVTCPWHEWQFDASTGLSTEKDGHAIEVYETRQEGGNLLVGGIKRPPVWKE